MSQGSSNPTTNLTKINGTTVSVNSGTTDAGTQRVILATNQPVIPVSDNGGSLTVDGSVTVSGTVTATGPLTDTQLRATAVPVSLASVPSHPVTNAGTFPVQVSSALPAGTNNIGDVDVLSVVPGTGATNLGKQTDSVAGATDTGVAILGIRDDVLTTLTPADGDYTRFRFNSVGRVWTSATIDSALPAGTNNIGDVDVASLPGTVAADITAIKTGVELLDNAVNVHDAVASTTGLQVSGFASTTAPTAVVAGDSARIWTTLNGAVNIADGGSTISIDDGAGSITVDGTVAATQSGTWNIGSITTLPSIPAGANTIGNVNVNGTVPVSGTFWQATQPVSGSVTVSGTVTATGPLTDTQLRATAVPVSLASVPSHPVTNAGTFAVQVSSALPAGTNNIGDVDVLSLPALPAGANTIGAVNQAGTWNVNNISGTVSLPTGAATETTLNAVKTGVELLDNTVLAASTLPTATNQSLVVSLGPNSKGYDPVDDMMKVKSVQKKFRDSFVGSALDTNKWDSSIGTGGAITVSGGRVTIASGTTIASETSITSKEIFTIPFRVSAQLTLSQRIANQSFILEAISVNASTGVPDGLNTIAWVFDGTVATQGKYRVANGGATPLDSAASTITTTATTGGVYELEPFADEAWFHSAILDSTAGRAVSYRRHQQIPDPNAVYKIRCRWLNGGTAPASNSNAVMQFVACQDYAELTAEITAGRGNAAAGQSLGVQVLNSVTTAAHAVYNAPIVSSTTYQPTNATTTAYANSLVVKASLGALYSITGYNSKSTGQFIQIHNTTTVPADGVAPQVIFFVPALSNFAFDLNPYGRYFATGITVCNSSTGPTKTIGAADCWFDVQYR